VNTTIDLNNKNIFTTKVFSKTLYKTNFSNKKGNQVLLGIDILKEDVRKELLLLAVSQLEELYEKLLSNPKYENVLRRKGKLLFLECIKNVCEDFLTKKYGYKVRINLTSLKNSLYVKNLLKDTDILFKVPFFSLMDPNSPYFLSIYYPIYNSASESFIEALIDNLALEISNSVVYFSLVNFSSVYAFRQILYRSKFLSLRNLERFKNNLNWQLYIKSYIQRPINLYNNRHEIYIFKTTGIYCRIIYANRAEELFSLKNLSLLTIIIVEISDFIISRFDEAVFVLSKSVRFTLTTVLGQVIGLVWRGIIEGLKK
tara:strand:+ start:2364 stop:3305 length:942 start_codon:yes stop_codon:yes gene_type:complete